MNRYPIFIISKGRFKTRKTSTALDAIMVPYRMVVEALEFDDYAQYVDVNKLLKLPVSNAGHGSIPARNFCLDTAISEGYHRHWVLDDNIEQFNRLNNNLQVKVTGDAIFRAAEDFVDRYKNIALAGFQYDYFAKAKTPLPPFQINTRIYSCTLVNNMLPFRWRGTYNEDTDLSLRVLKAGYNTILFYAFIQQKTQTLKQSGGNEDIYKSTNERWEFAESLRSQHPDVVKVVRRYNRWHHQVNYRPFQNRCLEFIDGYKPPEYKIDNYGMFLHNKEAK